jgi:hypothetical protein
MDKQILLDYKDVPEWVQSEIYNVSRSKPQVRLYVVENGTASVSGPAYDWSCRHLIARNGKGQYLRAKSGYYESYLNLTSRERAVQHGGKIPIPDDGVILSVDTHAKIPSLYVTPAHPLAKLARRLPAGDDELDEVERMVLEHYAGLNSRGRSDAIWRYNIPMSLILVYTQALARKELVKVNKRGAVTVTTKGHNVRSATPAPWSWYSFSNDSELRDRVIAKARAYDFGD